MTREQFDLAYRLLREEHKYEEGTLPRKAIHKLLYLVDSEAKSEEIEIDIPYFWFQFGVVTPAESDGWNSGSNQPSPRKESVQQGLTPDLRPVVKRVLNRYYSSSLEEITDETYQNAPYDVQRSWRQLDKKLRTLHSEHPDFYKVEPSRDSVEDSIYDVYDAFPTARYPELESDLTKWYSMITRELNRPEMDSEEMMEINVLFWRIVSLEIAEEHRHKMSKEEIEEILDIESFDTERESCREKLRRLETETLDDKFGDDDEFDTPETRAADALAEGTVAEYLPNASD